MYTRLDATLKELNVVNLLMAGVSTGACVESTARDAVSRDYFVYMLSDVTAASGISDLGWGEMDSDTLQRVFLTNFAYHLGESGFDRRVDGRVACKIFGARVKNTISGMSGTDLKSVPHRLHIFLL